MADDKQKKVETGKNLFDIYQKKKHKDHGSSGEMSSTVESLYDTAQSFPSPGSTRHTHEGGKTQTDVGVAYLLRKTAEVEGHNDAIRHLHQLVKDKDERIKALEIENRILMEGQGDHLAEEADNSNQTMINKLQEMVTQRDLYIDQLSASLRKRSEELECSVRREGELTRELRQLQDKVTVSEAKLQATYTDMVHHKAEVELLHSQHQEYLNKVEALSTQIYNQQVELQTNNRNISDYKVKVSKEVKFLMEQTEKLNQDIAIKQEELNESRKEVNSLRSELEKKFEGNLSALKKGYESQVIEDVQRIKTSYDEELRVQFRKSEAEIQKVHAQVSSITVDYENEKVELTKLLEKNKSMEKHLLRELEKYKQEAAYYKQQVENFENKFCEEVKKMRQECDVELRKCEEEMSEFRVSCQQEKIDLYEEEIDKLTKNLKDCAIKDARREVELETYVDKLKKCEEEISCLKEDLEGYKKGYENKINQYEQNEQQLQQGLIKYKTKVQQYEQQVSDFNRQKESDIQQLNQKCESFVNSSEEEIAQLTCRVKQQQEEIDKLHSQLAERNSTDARSMEDQSYMFQQNLIVADKIDKSNRAFMLDVLLNLRDIKTYIANLIHSSVQSDSQSMKAPSTEKDVADLSDDDAVNEELKKTVNELLDLTQTIHQGFDGHIFNSLAIQETNMKPGPHNFITSTPNVKKFYDCGAINNNYPADLTEASFNMESINYWMMKCDGLEKDNEELTKQCQLLTVSQKEMEHCLLVTMQESRTFNETCQALDTKMSELEKSKMSQYLLKKENDDLKNKLIHMQNTESKLQRDLESLSENNLKLEKLLNKNNFDLHKKVTNGEFNEELQRILADSKEKSEQVITLKSQVMSSQKLQREQHLHILELKSRYDQLVAKNEFLMMELTSKKRELEDVWEENSKMLTKNKMLQAKLLPSQDENTLETFKTQAKDSDDTKVRYIEEIRDQQPLLGDMDTLSLTRLRTLHLLSTSCNLTSEDEASGSNHMPITERIAYQLQTLDQMFGSLDDVHMPTILEEEEDTGDNQVH